MTTGFARNAVLGVAGEVVKAVQEGHLKHIFLIGGCDGSGEQRAQRRLGWEPARCAAARLLASVPCCGTHCRPHPCRLPLAPAEPDRKYFGRVADATPQDTMVLTLGCGKFRFYDHDFGMLPNTPLPRL